MTEGSIDALVSLGVTKKIANEVGCRLREARQARGQTTAAIAAKIRVREHYLVAMESGDWEILPAGVNGRGLIRIYARDLGVCVPELEGKSVASTSEPKPAAPTTTATTRQEQVTVRARTGGASAPRSPRAAAPVSRAPRKSGALDSQHVAGGEDDDSQALDATQPELANLLGIPSETPSSRPPMPRAEVVMENDVPVVRADLLAEEMFTGIPPMVPQPVPTETRLKPVVESAPQAPVPSSLPPDQPPAAPTSESEPLRPETVSEAPPAPETESVSRAETAPETPSEPPVSEAPYSSAPESAPEPETSQPLAETPASDTRFQPLPEEGVVSGPAPSGAAGEAKASEAKEPSSSPIKWIVAAAVVLLTGGAFILFTPPAPRDEGHRATETSSSVSAEKEAPREAEAKSAEASVAPAQASAAPEATLVPTAEATQAMAEATPTPAPAATEAPPVSAGIRKATLKVLSPVGMTIRIDGKPFFTGTQKAGSLEIEFHKTADIYVDDGSKVSLDYAGWENHGNLGWTGRKRRVVLNAESYSGQGHGSL